MDQAISFPGLGLTFNPSRVAFHIGSRNFYWYGIIIAVGFLLAVWYALRRCNKFGITQDHFVNMLICAVPSAIVGARLYYVFFQWDYYKDNPIHILYIWEGGLAIYGGVIFAVLAVLIYTKATHQKTLPFLDLGSLGLLIGQCIGRWGNFVNREAHGTETNSFLRMGLTDASGNTIYVHPTFLYESVWNLIGFILLHNYSKRRRYDGQIFVMYLGWYGLGRMFIEGLRTDSLYVPGTNLRISQLVAGVCFVAAAGILFYNKVFKEHDPADLWVNQVAAAEAAATAENPQAGSTEEESDVNSDENIGTDSDGLAEEQPGGVLSSEAPTLADGGTDNGESAEKETSNEPPAEKSASGNTGADDEGLTQQAGDKLSSEER